MTNDSEASRISERLSLTSWAPILLEPLPGSEERVAVALVAVNAEGETGFLSLTNPETAKTHFRDAARYVQDIVCVTMDSCKSALRQGVHLAAWQPPLEGVFLGVVQETLASSPNDFLRLAAPLSSFLYRDPIGDAQQSRSKPKTAWSTRVRKQVLEANRGLKGNFDVPIHLGNHDAPAVFGFIYRSFAANLTTLSGKNLSGELREARSKLWTLNLLEDAPDFLFKPERRELLTGVDIQDDDPRRDLVHEAAEELGEEGARRGVSVIRMGSVKKAARHLLKQALAA